MTFVSFVAHVDAQRPAEIGIRKTSIVVTQNRKRRCLELGDSSLSLKIRIYITLH
ncbi:hypothetical protein [Sphingomonas sp. F9_3S_D5_B_2]